MASVLHRTGVASSGQASKRPSRLKVPRNMRGRTKRFTVYVDAALGPGGKRDADVVLARCEADYAKISRYFGGLSAGPFSVILFSNPKGAHHLNCAATDLYCDAKTKPARGNHSEFLNVAELVEVFEAVQAKGWDCRKSNGEGLSRVLAADLYPAEVDGFTTAHVWLDSRRPNYVDRNINSDANPTANGCAVLFLNWLCFQHGHSWRHIVAAAAPTLGRTYSKLTGRTDGFNQFRALLDSRFPVGRPSQLATDNPFPL